MLPSDTLIHRAVELWCRALKAPVMDNGDKSWAGSVMHGILNERAGEIASSSTYPERLERFREALTNALIDARDRARDGGDYFDNYIGADYHPSHYLKSATEKVGIPEAAVPIKSSVNTCDDYVTARFGYGARTEYHYPLPDGRWLVTRLLGEDMPAIIKAVAEGRLPELIVEP